MIDGKLEKTQQQMNFSFWPKRRIPVVRQLDSAECGLACLTMIAHHHGLPITMEFLRLRYPASSLGTRLSTLVEIGNDIGLSCRPVRLEMNELHNLSLPCILHWKMGHYVVLTTVKKNGIFISDPSGGELFVKDGDVNLLFTGIALELSRKEIFSSGSTSKINSKVNWWKLAGKTSGFHATLARSFVLAIVLELFSLAQPVITQVLVDQSSKNSDKSLILILAASVGLLCLSGLVLGSARTWIISVIQNRLFLSSSSDIFSHLLHLPSAFFERRRLGDVISRFNSVGSIQKILSAQLVEAGLDSIVSALTLAVLCLYNGIFAAIALSAFTAQIIVKILFYPAYAEASAKTISLSARQQNRIVECVRLVHTIRGANAQSKMVGRFVELGNKVVAANLGVQRYQVLLDFLSSLIFNFEKIGVMTFAALLVMNHESTVGALIAVSFLSIQFSTRSRSLVEYLLQLRLLKLQQGRLADIVKAAPEANYVSGYIGSPQNGDVVLAGVSFKYDSTDKWIFSNLTLTIAEGEFVAFVGASGAGKSTLIKLLMGSVSPTAGRVSIGNVDLESFGKSRYRRMLGVALQDEGVFSGSIAENISMFDESATVSDIERAAKLACVHADIIGKPMGYNTPLGGIESHVSAGQRQRILLARAFYRKPQIIILDEATCHVDMKTERQILKNLADLKITRIMVTHRPEAAAFADKIHDVATGKTFSPKQQLRRDPVSAHSA